MRQQRYLDAAGKRRGFWPTPRKAQHDKAKPQDREGMTVCMASAHAHFPSTVTGSCLSRSTPKRRPSVRGRSPSEQWQLEGNGAHAAAHRRGVHLAISFLPHIGQQLRLPLRSHHARGEHWVFVTPAGNAELACRDQHTSTAYKGSVFFFLEKMKLLLVAHAIICLAHKVLFPTHAPAQSASLASAPAAERVWAHRFHLGVS
ncbi:hypothetical protein GQ54DRAFT_221545 [Martensiomyces pterosporus]|nr:hypothetical protein GQ54DRAFT_221545 [Martensiomyces pterosporus]